MTYNVAVKSALATLDVPCYHNKAHKQDNTYIVWRESGSDGLYASDKLRYRVRRISVDIFTKQEYTDLDDKTIRALEDMGFTCVPDVEYDYEEDTGYRHCAITALWV